MPLSTTYKEYILEQLHKEYLLNGVIPTSDQLEADLLEYQKTHPDLSLPKSKYLDFNVERGSSSSAEHIKTIAETVSSDIAVIVREIYSIAKKNSAYFERWSYQVKALASKAKTLEHRVDSLLMMRNLTSGFFAAVGDVFTDLNLVDTDETTTMINVDEQAVTLNPGSTHAAAVTQINTNNLTSADVSFYSLSGQFGTVVADINKLVNVFKPSVDTWVGQITSERGKSISAELKAAVSRDKDIEVSKLSMEYAGPINSQSLVSAMYSADGYTWYLVPCSDATKPLLRGLVWNFPLTKMRWIKFLFYKSAPDDGKVYDFSIKYIRLYGNTYAQDAGNIFVSKALQATSPKGDPVEFSSVQLDVCENLSTGTSIKYYVSASKDNVTWTGWTDILPSIRQESDYPKIVSFGGATWFDSLKNSPVVSPVLNQTQDRARICAVFDPVDTASTSIYSRFKNNSFGAVNVAVTVAENKDPDIVGNSILLWRNTRLRGSYSVLDSYPDVIESNGSYFSRTVRGVPRGWGSDGLVYTCFFEVLNPDGKVFNFGGTSCTIDNQKITGTVNISQGVHKFTTEAKNWFDIAPTSPVLLSSELDFKSVDPLYPYNHKLLIEGYSYPSTFSGEKIYSGTDMSAEFYCTKTSLFDLENNNRDYNYFAVKGVGTHEEDSTTYTVLSVILGFDSNNSDYTNELCLIKWRGGDTSENYKYVKLKAELETEDTGLSPVLTSYRLKLGV